MNKLVRKEGPCISSATAAQYYFPDIFARPRDEYVAAMLKEIAMNSKSEISNDPQNSDSLSGIQSMNCYLGNVHVPPITRMLKTYNSDGVYASGNDDPLLNEGDDQGGKGRSLLLRRRRERREIR